MAESSKPSVAGSGNDGPLYAPESGFSLFVKLFIVPALIVAAALGIFFLGTLALEHPKSAEQYLSELKGDSTNKRWQAAFELSRMMNSGEKIQFNQQLRGELTAAYQDAGKDDPRVRQYLAVVLGTLKEKSAVSALSQGVAEGSKDVKIYSLWALGNIEDQAGGEAALKALSDEDLGVRRMAVGALSSMRYKPAQFVLEKNLEDPAQAIRYDSAVALARLKDSKAVPVLLEMMSLKSSGKGTDEIIQSAKLAAIEGAGELSDAKLAAKVREMGKNDPDLAVRGAAIKANKK